jgi:Tripartite tricarboxylate transporter TctB family
MWSNLFGSKDFWAGLMLIALGGMTVLVSRAYPMGTVLRMGAGYFPTVLGGILIVFGLILLLKGVRSTDRLEPNWSPRALFVIPVALILFALLVERIGFAPSLLMLIVGSAAASSEFRLLEAVVVGAVLTALSVAVFIWGLGLPYPLLVLPW